LSERRLTVGAAPRLLEARLAEPPSPPSRGAVVCHPHPEYGGDMHNPVVEAAVRGCLEAGWAALRFNFAGVGESGGRYSGGDEEVHDVEAAAATLRDALPAHAPLVVVGYSFGAWVGARAAGEVGARRVIAIAPALAFLDWSVAGARRVPLAVIVGDRDQYCPRERLALLPAEDVTLLEGADHFLAGRDGELTAAVRAALERP
jgi:alpha/beta superfamily hydrolase